MSRGSSVVNKTHLSLTLVKSRQQQRARVANFRSIVLDFKAFVPDFYFCLLIAPDFAGSSHQEHLTVGSFPMKSHLQTVRKREDGGEGVGKT